MIAIKNERELASMRQACKITAAARALAGEKLYTKRKPHEEISDNTLEGE